MSKGTRFWNFMAKRYARSPIRNMEAYQETLERTRRYLSKEDTVLEVGCGTGSTALILAENVARYTAADSSIKMNEIANAKLADTNPGNLSFLHAEVTDLRLAEEPVNRLLAYNLLHLLPDLDEGLQALHKVVKPGGIFISKTICVASGSHFWRGLLGLLAPLGLLPHVNFMGHDVLEKAMTDAGFEILESSALPENSQNRFIVARRKGKAADPS